MHRAILTAVLSLFGAVDATAQGKLPPPPAPGQTAEPPRRPQVPQYFIRPELFPGFEDIVTPLNRFAFLRDHLVERFRLIDEQYMADDRHRFSRWEWLSAQRAALRSLDMACTEVAALRIDCLVAIQRRGGRGMTPFDDFVTNLERFPELRIKYRYGWYYTTQAHHWNWERKLATDPSNRTPILNHRLRDAVCKKLGISSAQLLTALAYIDLIATDLLPAHMSQFLIIPLGLMS
jgi:hypothetical protein